MTRTRSLLLLPLFVALAGCAVREQAVIIPPSGPDPLYTPSQVVPGRLEYAPDRTTFAPILTERFTYPTQPEANVAYLRLIAAAPLGPTYPSSVWLFGCKPGALDAQTARVSRYGGPVVHCATDFLDRDGRRLRRETANFYYYNRVWSMQPVYPPRSSVSWRNREHSPRDFWWWLPGRPRYE